MPTIIDPTLRPFHAAVYAAIREAWVDYGEAPSQHQLSLAVQCSSTTVHQALAELRRRGYIIQPKHSRKMVKPTDIDREILIKEPDPWDDLNEPKKYWTPQK